MKKTLLLIPALLSLSACGGANPKDAEPATFLEDTTAHTELFGKAEEIKPIRRNAASITEPSIGYQLKYEGGKLAIRFVATIFELDADITATWSRGVAGADGTDLGTGKGFDDTLESTTKYYKSLTGWGDADDGTGYVVYSLYNIPYNETNRNAYVAAYLTLTDTASHVAKSKVLAVKIDCGDGKHDTSESFFTIDHTIPDGFEGKHFLQGTIGGAENQKRQATEWKEGDNYAVYSDVSLTTSDSFGSFYYSPSCFQYFGYQAFVKPHSLVYFREASLSGYNQPKVAGTYELCVSRGDSNQIYATADTEATVDITFKVNMSYASFGAEDKVAIAGDFNGWNTADYMDKESDKIYTKTFNGLEYASWQKFKFVINNSWGTSDRYDRYLQVDVDSNNVTYYYNLYVEPSTTITVAAKDDWGPFHTQVPTFVCLMGGNAENQWVPVEYTAGELAYLGSFTVPEGVRPERFLVVRCSDGTTIPDWDIQSGDAAGRIYNQTDDIYFDGNTGYDLYFHDYPSAN